VAATTAAGALTYTPNAGRFGSDSFTFKANDGALDSAPATVTVTILPALAAGDLLVTDSQAKLLAAIDPVTGDQAIVSSGGNFIGPRGVAIESSGTVLVLDGGTSGGNGGSPGPLIRVNPADGSQTVVVPASSLHFPIGVAVEPNGNILVGDGPGGLSRFSSAGTFQNTFSGGNLHMTAGVTVAPDGQIYVSDAAFFMGGISSVVQIDPVSGNQTVVSSGGNLKLPLGITRQHNGVLLIAEAGQLAGQPNSVISIDPATGVQTVLSSSGDLHAPTGVALNQGGEIFTANDASASVVKVDAVSGAQTVSSSGGILVRPWGVAAILPPDTTPPVFTVCPAGQDLGCNPGSLPDCASVQLLVQASDDSGGPVTLHCTSADTTSGCTVTRTFTITASDTHGNTTPSGSECIVVYHWKVDVTPPVITLNGPATISLCRGLPYNESGATAADDCDGSVSVSVGGASVDVRTPTT